MYKYKNVITDFKYQILLVTTNQAELKVLIRS